MSSERDLLIDRLRQQISTLEVSGQGISKQGTSKQGSTRLPAREGLPSGVPELDEYNLGWPRPGISVVRGAPGTGRLGLLLPALQELTRRQRWVGVVDCAQWLYPPGLPGVALDWLLMVCPGGEQAAWAAAQLARCAVFPLVIVLDPPRMGRGGRRLQRAAEAGESAVVVVGELKDGDLPVDLLLEMTGPSRARLVRSRRGHAPGRVRIPDLSG